MFIYKEIANQFINDIEAGRLSEGSRMPSLRKVSKQHAVSMSTAVSCYQELESRGWIYSRPQAGYYVSAHRKDHQTPDWVQFVSKVSEVNSRIFARQHDGLISAASTNLDEIALNELDRSFKRINKRLGQRLSRYPSSQGEPLLRNALSTHFSKIGLHIDPDELIITSGCMPALKTALEACTKPGDAIAISSPCFNGILELLSQMGRQIVEIPSTDEGVDLSQVESLLQQRVIQAGLFCTSHMNPQGITMSVQQKQRLAELANQYRIPIIEDDVYLELSHSDYTPLPARYYDKAGYILWCGSISKSLSPSYRLGWCLPGRYTETYHRHHAASRSVVSLPIQLTIADFIESGHYAKQLKRRRNKLLNQRQLYFSFLTKHLPSNVKISNPQGGMVLWLQVPQLDTACFAKLIHENEIDIPLGNLFSSLDLYNDCFRINIGYELTDAVLKELKLLIDAIKNSVKNQSN